MTHAEIDFAALLCSRLCHDLISPVGALTNGIEILNDENDPDIRAQVVELLAQSATQTSNRLQFFRLAFGAAGGFGEKVDVREAHRAIGAFFGSERTRIEWHSALPAMRKDSVKLLLNLSLLAGEGLIRGGTLAINITGSDDGPVQLSVRAEGPKFLFAEVNLRALADDLQTGELDPRTAPAWLAGTIIKATGASLETNRFEGGLEITVHIP